VIVDIHSHLYPQRYLDDLRRATRPPRVVAAAGQEWLVLYPDQETAEGVRGARLGPAFYDPSARLAAMDRAGVDVSVLSLGNPWFEGHSAGDASGRAAAVNDELAAICDQSGGRFRMFAAVPTGDLAAATAELARINGRPGVVGVLMGTRLGGQWLDRDSGAFWDQVERMGLPVFLHPHPGVGGDDLVGYGDLLRLGLGFPFETAVAATRLILSGTLDRHPGLKLILAHGGGALPALMPRLLAYAGLSQEAALCAPDSLARFWYDTLTYSSGVLRMLAESVGPSRLMYGTDRPYAAADDRALQEIIRQMGWDDAQMAGVLGGNAIACLNIEE
jgi:aminocarboxymuconate-semialdehyde decarboxylase